MSANELAGARVAYGFGGTSAPAALLRRIHAGRLAGVILFSRNIRSRPQLRALVARLQRARPAGAPPLLVMVDQEGGLVKRLPGAPSRSPAQIGRTGSARIARHEGAATARNLRGVGANVDLAPVLDVGRRGGNIRALGRSFGATAGRVVKLGGAFASGLTGAGVAATGKHFPGLGLARGNQDDVLNVIKASRHTLRAVDEAPYAALAGRLQMVMVSSAIYPALDRGRPALFSRRIATGELRGRVGFTGVSVSDSLDVRSVLRFGGPGTRALRSARAGVDLLLFEGPVTGGAAQQALAHAIAAGRANRTASERSAARVLSLRARLATR